MCRLCLLLFALVFVTVPTFAQDCDSDTISNTAELGPFAPDGGHGLVLLGTFGDEVRASAASTDFSLSGQSFTIEFWLYRDITIFEQQYVFFNGNEFANQGLTIGFRADLSFTFAFWGNDLDTAATYFPDAQWHHWACVYDADTNTRRILRDGVEVASDIAPSDYLGPSGPILLGGLASTAGFDGVIDELRIWNYARSDAQIMMNMNTQFDQVGVPSDLHAYYPFGPGPAGEDLAGSNDLSLVAPIEQLAYELDCNSNGIPDNCDIDSGFSDDNNTNGIPDECESDCNSNGISDLIEIMEGMTADTNMDGIPDECESIENITQGTFWLKLQDAVENADTDDEIVLHPGIHGTEDSIVFIEDSITIRSTNPSDPATVESTIINPEFGIYISTPFFEEKDIILSGLHFGETTLDPLHEGSLLIDRCWLDGQLQPGPHRIALGVIGVFGSQVHVTNSRITSFGSVLSLSGGKNAILLYIDQSLIAECESGINISGNFGDIVSGDVYITQSTMITEVEALGISTPENSTVSISNSIVRGGISTNSNTSVTYSQSNIEGVPGMPGDVVFDADPMFADPDGPDNDPTTIADNDYSLLPMSPSVDTGLNLSIPEDITDIDNDNDTMEQLPLDLAGNERIVNTTVDMGAFETQIQPCPADFTGEGDLNFLDVSAFLTAFGNQDPAADFTGEGQFNFLDVSAFLSAFGAGCP